MNLKVSEKIRKLCKSKFPKTHYILDFVQALLIHISRRVPKRNTRSMMFEKQTVKTQTKTLNCFYLNLSRIWTTSFIYNMPIWWTNYLHFLGEERKLQMAWNLRTIATRINKILINNSAISKNEVQLMTKMKSKSQKFTDRCIKDFCASLSIPAILSNKTFEVPLPSPASLCFQEKSN